MRGDLQVAEEGDLGVCGNSRDFGVLESLVEVSWGMYGGPRWLDQED